jgi:CBS domain-containing protein
MARSGRADAGPEFKNEGGFYMTVHDAMTMEPAFCGPDMNAAQAVGLMWKGACGFLPAVGEGGNVIGVITDRNIAIGLGTRNQRASQVHVSAVMPHKLFTCTPNDDIYTALKTLRIEGIRPLPVTDREGALVWVVLSIDDVVLTARIEAHRKDVSCEDIENTYKAILLHSSLSKNRGHQAA